MQTDLYTKTILTVIAICLSLICLEKFNFVQSAFAETKAVEEVVMKVEVTNTPFVRLDLRNQDHEYRLPISIEEVRLPSDEALPIIIDDVRSGIFNELPIKNR